ncbi:MFS transporter [Planctomycetaceae bacterium SH139]
MDVPFARTRLMWASFLTLVASGVGFATRTAAGGAWESEFGLEGGQFGQILGAGFLGFGLMIFFGGILVERFGYKRLLVLAFLLHLFSGLMLFAASPMFAIWRESNPETATANVFSLLFWSAFVFSICQGLYEAVINPLIAQLYPDAKTHYLNILHAGWPAGMIIGGVFAAGFLGDDAWFVPLAWQVSLAFFVVFVLIYGIMALPVKFPPTMGESSKEGFSVVFSCFASIPFLVLIVLHALIGYMELGVDSWMAKLMENFLPNAILVLVYTSALMFILRFFAGPIVHRLNPIGLLLASSVIACLGLIWLSSPIQTVFMIFVAATFYSLGKAFLWPTMLGVAGERYPKSGSVAMGALGAAGMLTVGQIAGPRIGTQQGYAMSERLKTEAPETFERYAKDAPEVAWGYEYQPIIPERLSAANSIDVLPGGELSSLKPIEEAKLIDPEVKTVLLASAAEDVPKVQEANIYGGRQALWWTAIIPAAMSVGFLGLFIYYALIGGYKPVDIYDSAAHAGPSPPDSGEDHPEEVEATAY